MIYLDSCALVKLVVPEAETTALETYLRQHSAERHVASALVRTEMRRALARAAAPKSAFATADRLLGSLVTLRIDDALLDAAGLLPDRALRSLDAIHLATAQALGGALTALVTYDQRLLDAARRAGLPTAAPS